MGRPELFHNDAGRAFTLASVKAGCHHGERKHRICLTMTVTAVWISFLGGYYAEASTFGI